MNEKEMIKILDMLFSIGDEENDDNEEETKE